MALIKLTESAARKYRMFLQSYRNHTGKEPGPIERAEAYFCAQSASDWDRPSWI